jgi:hypothetical protein
LNSLESGFFNTLLDRRCAKLRVRADQAGRTDDSSSSKFVHGTFALLLCASAAFGAKADVWKADWEKTLQVAKKKASWCLRQPGF